MQKNVQDLIAGWRSRGYHVGFGVGLASGPATVGRIGYEDRLDYTAIGSVVNLAARLCASAADREILIDAEVAASVRGRRPLEELGDRQIKGFDEAIPVFGIILQMLLEPMPWLAGCLAQSVSDCLGIRDMLRPTADGQRVGGHEVRQL